ncbi:hypothetical protein GY21_01190 [Cryobacterium roopkundense]|uniref:Uncharacterized protein n=1 Tax=Cryobacterium roopkundense TaxID=1001240 RepID=A0A099JVN0_9MICO|nr:hypothetical protein [Cryobacterium roopkundense]KGJ81732.1 hypothetical protein GY21_01190 [Cryobacterium roopkundense]MBB5642474.1 hypothetical protein [Cryobacterium roopkundense]
MNSCTLSLIATAAIGVDGTPAAVAAHSAAGLLHATQRPASVVVTVTKLRPAPRGITGHTDALTQASPAGLTPETVAVNPLTHRVDVVDTGESTLATLDPIIPNVVSTATASAVVLAGPRTASLEGIDFGAVPYSRTVQVAAGASTDSAAGWAIASEVSAFVWSAPGGSATDAADIAASHLAITSVGSVATVSGQAWATDPIAVTGALNTPVTVPSAAVFPPRWSRRSGLAPRPASWGYAPRLPLSAGRGTPSTACLESRRAESKSRVARSQVLLRRALTGGIPAGRLATP